MNFETFNLDPLIMDGVRRMGYEEPTPIQQRAIPPIMEGRDIIGLAQTGTGKTAAFVLPILHRLINHPQARPRALVISPTRELAEQTYEASRDLGQFTGLKSIAVYGGVGMDMQVQKLRKGIDIVVACPGRLLDHLLKGTVDLSDLEVLVIDEADRMFDMGFLTDIRNIVRCIMRRHQTLLFSATMPADIRKLVQEVLHNPVTVQIGQSAPAKTVSHAIYPVKQHLKTALLIELLRQHRDGSALVFMRTKHRTERVAQQLKKAGFKATSLQGNLSQYSRQIALEGFRDGRFDVMVATDIAARGIDISHITHVINYDMPDTTDAYIHRIGRTGRVNRNGDALTFVTSTDMAMVRDLEKILKAPLERRTLEGFNYDVSAPKNDFNRPPSGRPASNRPRRSGGRSRGGWSRSRNR